MTKPTGRPRGRPPIGSAPKHPIRLNIDPDVLAAITNLAERTGHTKTRLIEQAITEFVARSKQEDPR